jgi:hypothetical protein
MHQINDWQNMYPSNWKGTIIPEAMAHPAKYSSKLIRRIYEHLFDMGWLKAGDRVVDPFGGVALGALDAMRLGLDWTGCELEQKFFELGNANIARWNTQFGRMPGWGSARLLNGDSRRLLEIVGNWQQTSISSPPYMETDVNYRSNGLKENGEAYQRPYMVGQDDHYGSTPGQLGAMKGDGFDVAISSHPFLQSEGGAHVPSYYADDPTFMSRHAAGNKSSHAYGETDGQLSSMRDGGYDVAVSSPPYEESPGHTGRVSEIDIQKGTVSGDQAQYGDTQGQLVNADDFWTAARTIVEQVYACLEPGSHAVWVVKDYVKAKKIVPFCDQWRQLCEAVGFTTLHEHHAMLVHHKGSQHTLEGGLLERKTESKSFFRRLAEKNGSPRIDYEVVFCMVK